jgi:hypothetical protein
MQKHVEGFRLSPQQARLWLLKGQNPADHLSQMAILVEGSLDVESLKSALREIVARHGILRTGFYVARDRARDHRRPPVRVIPAGGPLRCRGPGRRAL